MDNIIVKLIDMDTRVSEQVVINADDSYTIFLNARLNQERNIESYNHALQHIMHGDFERTDVQEIEAVAHGLTERKPEPAPAPQCTLSDKEIERRIRAIRQKRQRIQIELQKMQERGKWLDKHCDMLAIAERQWLYGKDL